MGNLRDLIDVDLGGWRIRDCKRLQFIDGAGGNPRFFLKQSNARAVGKANNRKFSITNALCIEYEKGPAYDLSSESQIILENADWAKKFLSKKQEDKP